MTQKALNALRVWRLELRLPSQAVELKGNNLEKRLHPEAVPLFLIARCETSDGCAWSTLCVFSAFCAFCVKSVGAPYQL